MTSWTRRYVFELVDLHNNRKLKSQVDNGLLRDCAQRLYTPLELQLSQSIAGRVRWGTLDQLRGVR